MTCQAICKRLPLLDDPELSASERLQIERHLASCSDCASEAALIRSAQEGLHALGQVNIPEHGLVRVLQITHGPEQLTRGWHWSIAKIFHGHPLPFGSLVATCVALLLFVVLPTVQTGRHPLGSLGDTAQPMIVMNASPPVAAMRSLAAKTMAVAPEGELTIHLLVDSAGDLVDRLVEYAEEAHLPWTVLVLEADGTTEVVVNQASSRWVEGTLRGLQENFGASAVNAVSHFTQDTPVEGNTVTWRIELRASHE